LATGFQQPPTDGGGGGESRKRKKPGKGKVPGRPFGIIRQRGTREGTQSVKISRKTTSFPLSKKMQRGKTPEGTIANQGESDRDTLPLSHIKVTERKWSEEYIPKMDTRDTKLRVEFSRPRANVRGWGKRGKSHKDKKRNNPKTAEAKKAIKKQGQEKWQSGDQERPKSRKVGWGGGEKKSRN